MSLDKRAFSEKHRDKINGYCIGQQLQLGVSRVGILYTYPENTFSFHKS